MRAALRLLRRHGVLAGLNLREVADEAGLNRGLIYHYFGSRRALLRAALARVTGRGSAVVDEARPLPFAERRRRVFEILARGSQFASLGALLALDGDESYHPFPHIEQTKADLRRDVDQRHLPPDADPLALHAVTSAAILGYSLFREAFARDLGVSTDELDRRATDAFAMLLRGVATDQSLRAQT